MEKIACPKYSELNEKERLFIEKSDRLAAVYDRLFAYLGHENYVGEWLEMDQQRINLFASATNDHQWLHTDPERAKAESPFKATIAHGYLTLSLIPFLADSVNPDKNDYPEASLIVNMGMSGVKFTNAVKAGNRIRVRNRVVRLTPLKAALEIEREVTVDVENSIRPACVAGLILKVYFR